MKYFLVRHILILIFCCTHPMQDGMTAIHLAGRYGHIDILEVLKDRVSWKVTSTKVGILLLS